jgi:hypothetical protein
MSIQMRLLMGILCTALGGAIAAGQSTPQYQVLSSSEFFLNQQSGNVTSVQVLDRSQKTLTAASSITQFASGSPWWDIALPGGVFEITNPARTYDVLYEVDGKPAPPIEISLSLKLTVTIGTIGTTIRDYWLVSNIILKVGNEYVADGVGADCDTGSTGRWNAFSFQDKSKTKTLSGRIMICSAPLAFAKTRAPFGMVRLNLDHSLAWRQNSFTVDPASANSFLSGITVDKTLSLDNTASPVVFADDATFNPPPAPASKDAAMFYANLQIAAGTGAAGAWGIDGKVALFNEPLLRGTLTLLSATANTGNNTANIKSTTYTDTIDWMLPASWAFFLWKQAPTTLTLIAGPKYETDYRFDRKNFLFSGDSIWSARKLYQPQNYRSKPKNGMLPKYGDEGYAKVGYELEFHAGIESGGALIDTKAQNTKKTQSITVPAYSIERTIPQIHSLYQQSIGSAGLLTFDSLLTARYLFDNENTVVQAADGSLSIKQVSGWKAIHTLTATWNPPKNNNVGLTATYKNGFDAPKFARVNSVLIGVLIEF